MPDKTKIAVIGLGYVGLRLAAAFGRLYPTIGFDINADRVDDLRVNGNKNDEPGQRDLTRADKLVLTADPLALRGSTVFLLAVPTPVDSDRHPDFSSLLAACRTVGFVMSKGALIIVESTVFPGATEEICVPELERSSGLQWKKDFNVGYSPERINLGDHKHDLDNIVKVVSGDTPEILDRMDELYRSVITAGTYRCESIQVAEAAKVIENTQRDLNIALVNELAIIFERLGLNTTSVLETAGTKWNFLDFKPGLVGGHCIGVDPYYLTYRARQAGYTPDVILAGRKINDSVGKFIANKTIELLKSAFGVATDRVVNILGFTFKENCSDVRNTQVAKMVSALQALDCEVNVCDPLADAEVVRTEYGIDIVSWNELPVADALIYAVAHKEFEDRLADISEKVRQTGVVVDVKSKLRSKYLNPKTVFWQF